MYGNGETVEVLRGPRPSKARKNRPFLIFLAASEGLQSFSPDQLGDDRNFDLAARYYYKPQQDDHVANQAEYLLSGGRSKFHSAKLFFEKVDCLEKYRGFLFLDGDIKFAGSDHQRFLRVANGYGFAIAQAGLTKDSYYSWEVTLARSGYIFRETSMVEVMAPYFTRDALLDVLPTFDQSISTYGLDRIWPQLIGSNQRVGVVDAIKMRHSQPICKQTGKFYQYLKSIGVNPRIEQRQVLKKYGVAKVRPFDRAGYVQTDTSNMRHLERVPLTRLVYPLIKLSGLLDPVQKRISQIRQTSEFVEFTAIPKSTDWVCSPDDSKSFNEG